MKITSDRDMTYQVAQICDASVGNYDVLLVVRDIVARYGIVDVADIDEDEFWSIVEDHDLIPV